MVVLFIPLSVIFLFLFCGIAFAMEVIHSFMDVLPFILAAIIVSVIVLGIHFIFCAFRSKRPNSLYSVSEFVMIFSITVGIIAFTGLLNLDRCHRWLSWFGEGLAVQILTYIGIVILSNLVFATIAYVMPAKIISSFVLLIPIAFPFVIYASSISVCTKSYSDYVTTHFTSMEAIQEYKIIKDSKIYYPDIFKGDALFPALLPYKYSTEVFLEGDIVYTVYNSVEYYEENGYTYITVSDGTKGGLVEINDLEKVDTPQYQYILETSTDGCPLYKADSSIINFNFPTKGSYTIWSKSDEILATLPAGQALTLVTDGVDEKDSTDIYLRIQLDDGTQGYIERENIAIVRAPLG